MKARSVCVWAIVVFGLTGSAQAQVQLHHFGGDSSGDAFGQAVSGAGDVDGDSIADLIVGAPRDDDNGTTSGSARVFSGASGLVLYTFLGDDAGDVFGYSVAGVGDIDGDERGDVFVGAPFDDNNGGGSGSARLFAGADGQILFTFDGDAAVDHLGRAVSGAGDVNGDGVFDLIVGAPQDNSTGPDGPGYARVISGSTGATIYTFSGATAGDRFGTSVSGAGDVDNDGFDDVIVGANQFTVNGGPPGYALVLSGRTGAPLHVFGGTATDDRFGTSVSGAGDVDGDDFDDVIVGAPQKGALGFGYANVYSGQTGALLYHFVGEGFHEFGTAVSGVGDVDKDGYDDVVASAPNPPPFQPFAGIEKDTDFGYAKVYSGRTGELIYRVTVNNSEDEFGISASGAGDVNGDGSPEIIVGAWQNESNLPGYARVYALACTDGDGDGYGAPGLATCPAGPETDCDDADASVNPGATEIPGNGKDDDCDPSTPDGSPGCAPVALGGASGWIGYLAVLGLLWGLGRPRNHLSPREGSARSAG